MHDAYVLTLDNLVVLDSIMIFTVTLPLGPLTTGVGTLNILPLTPVGTLPLAFWHMLNPFNSCKYVVLMGG